MSYSFLRLPNQWIHLGSAGPLIFIYRKLNILQKEFAEMEWFFSFTSSYELPDPGQKFWIWIGVSNTVSDIEKIPDMILLCW